jgi:nitroreductase
MQFFDVIDQRRSIRAYRMIAIEQAKVDAILSAARLAPSAGDLQAYVILFVEKPKTKVALAQAAFGQNFIADAPLVLVFLADRQRNESKYGDRGAMLYCVQDATIAAAYAQLAAAAQGLGACWIGAFDEGRVAKAIGAPAHLRPIALMPIGYPDEAPVRPPRRSLSELTRRERFGI